MPTHFEHGLTTAAKSSTLGEFGLPDPTAHHVWFNDFDDYAAAEWIITTTELGTGDATEAVADANNGILVITNDINDNDLDFLQWSGADASTAKETWLLAAGKKAWFKARLKVSDATESDFCIGLQVIDTTPLDATDGIYFQKDDGDAYLDVYCRKDATTGSNSAAAIATVVSDTYLTVGWYYDGVSTISYYVNDTWLGNLSATSSYLPDTELTISFGIMNGAAAAKVMSLDYIFVAMER